MSLIHFYTNNAVTVKHIIQLYYTKYKILYYYKILLQNIIQTSQDSNCRLQKHLKAFKLDSLNTQKYKFAKHLLNTDHR